MKHLPPILVSAPRGRVARLRGLGATVAPPSTAYSAPGAPALTTPKATAAVSQANAIAKYNQAVADFQSQVVAVVTAGDTYLNAGETAQALAAYQAAGAAGATSLGPEIDLIGYPAASQPWTQKAWKLNALLSATTAVADAQSYAKNMQLDYQIALSAVSDAINGAGAPLPRVSAPQVAMAAGMAAVIGAIITWWRP